MTERHVCIHVITISAFVGLTHHIVLFQQGYKYRCYLCKVKREHEPSIMSVMTLLTGSIFIKDRQSLFGISRQCEIKHSIRV
jgi:hypothetical protein